MIVYPSIWIVTITKYYIMYITSIIPFSYQITKPFKRITTKLKDKVAKAINCYINFVLQLYENY